MSLPRLALLKRYWLVFFRAPWSGTARCRPGRWMVTLGLWKWAFMHYVGYSSAFIRDVEACDITVWLCLDHQDLLQHRGAARAPSPDPNPSHQALHDRPQTTPQMYETPESRLNQLDDMEPVFFLYLSVNCITVQVTESWSRRCYLMLWSLLHWRPTGLDWPSTSQSKNIWCCFIFSSVTPVVNVNMYKSSVTCYCTNVINVLYDL